MNAEQFRERAELNQTLADYLDSIAQEAAPPGADRAFGPELLFYAAAYALYRWARNHFDHKDGLQDAELRQQMEEEVEALVKKGHTREDALAAVLAMHKAVTTRPPDDFVLKAAEKVLKGGTGS